MSEININGVGPDTFGTKMPNVFINRVTLEYMDKDTYTGSGVPRTELNFNLTLRFTKPEHVQAGTAEEYIKKNLSNVYLYAFLGYEEWILNYLQENKFSIEYWHRKGMYRTHYLYQQTRSRRIPLHFFIEEDNAYDSALKVGPNFDEDGNEIVEITNINIKMDTRYFGMPSTSSGARAGVIPVLEDIEKLSFFAYTGIKAAGRYTGHGAAALITTDPDDGLFSQRYSESDYTTESEDLYKKLESNAYFSDISYYHVLENGRIATKFFEAYVTPSGVPYFSEVLQSTNGRFYSTNNYSFDDVKARLETLIDLHNDNREADSTLDANIKNLEAIINATANRSGVLLQLSDYRATYPNKSPVGLSGAFYSEFVIAFAEIIQAVQQEDELTVKQLYDSLVIDNRYTFFTGTYTPPDPGGNFGPITSGVSERDVVRGVPYSEPSGCYIPNKWVIMSREAIMTNSSSEYSNEALAELYGVDAGAGADALRDSILDESDTLSRLLTELEEKYLSEGFTTLEARELAREELAFNFATGDYDEAVTEGALRSELLNPTLNGGDYLDLRSGDSVVINKGIFFFDYEKALHTQSVIAHVFDLNKLQKLFRINVPYEHFFVRSVELSRNELRLDAIDMEEGEVLHDRHIRAKMELIFKNPSSVYNYQAYIDAGYDMEYIDYPKNNAVHYKYQGGKNTGEVDNEAEIVAQRIKYLRPSFKIGSSTHTSGLHFINFDLPTTDEDLRLKNMNSLQNVTDTGTLDFSYLKSVDGAPPRVLDGYRLMAFKFFDVMDDDVAYYNTLDTDDDWRADLLKGTNNLDEARTCYSITVKTVDSTQLTYDNFVSYVVGVFNEFNDYYSRAADICNFNNITNEFNQFFIDQMSELFPESRAWVKAAYVANALGELLFGVTGTDIDFGLFNEKVLETVLRISPATGNLYQLTSFAEQFKSIIDYLTVADLGSEYGPASDEVTPLTRIRSAFPVYTESGTSGFSVRTLQFYNEKPIWEPVSGDITPDNVTLSDTYAGDYLALPTLAVPIGRILPVNTEADVGAGASLDSGILDVEDVPTGGSLLAGTIYPDWYGLLSDYDYHDHEPAAEPGLHGASLFEVLGNASKVFECVFMPRYSSSSGEAELITNHFQVNSYMVTGGAYTIDYEMFFDEYVPNVAERLKATMPSGGKLDDETLALDEGFVDLVNPTYAAYFLNRIMKYSTTDVDIKPFRTAIGAAPTDDYQVGRLRPGITARDEFTQTREEIINRRDYRNALKCLAVLYRIRKAAFAYVSEHYATPGISGHDMSDMVFASQEYELGNEFIPTLVASGLSSEIIFKVYERIMVGGSVVVKHLRTIIARIVNGETGLIDDYGLSEFFNPDDPIGPTAGTLGPDSGWRTDPTIDIDFLIETGLSDS